MNTKNTSSRVPIAAVAIAFLAVCATPGCAGHLEAVDGYDAEYVDAPPVNIESYPRYEVTDGYVYEVNGRYYHRHGNRWVTYHSAPPRVVHRERGEVHQAPHERERR